MDMVQDIVLDILLNIKMSGEDLNNWEKFTQSVQTSWDEFSWSEFKDEWEPWNFKKQWYWAVLFYLGCYVLLWWTWRTL